MIVLGNCICTWANAVKPLNFRLVYLINPNIPEQFSRYFFRYFSLYRKSEANPVKLENVRDYRVFLSNSSQKMHHTLTASKHILDPTLCTARNSFAATELNSINNARCSAQMPPPPRCNNPTPLLFKKCN